MGIGRKYKLYLLFSIVLMAYFPAIKNPICSIDDIFIVEAFGVNGSMSLLDVFRPGRGFYYRPLVNFSYYIDKVLWGLDPSFMHLGNILLHAINTVLVFLLASKVSLRTGLRMPQLPLLSALIFALHPINSEPVNWIAGRTDPLSATFVLMAAYFLIKSIDLNSHKYMYISLLNMLLGALCKETAIMFIPAAFLLVLRMPGQNQESSGQLTAERRKSLVLLLVASLVIGIFFLFHLFKRGTDNSISMLLDDNGLNFLHVIEVVLQAVGFYVKKFFLPLPLNLAIVSVSSYYVWMGIAVIAALILLFRNRNIYALFFVIGVLFILPAIVVALTKMTWTPYAERYLYIPSVFFSIGFIALCYMVLNKINKMCWVFPLSLLIILPAAYVTLQRTFVWQDNLTLMQDTVNKSPQFGVVRNELAFALINNGREEEAAKHLEIAQKLDNRDDITRIITLNQVGRKLQNKSPEEARAVLLRYVKDKQSADVELLKLLNRYDESRLSRAVDNQARRIVAKEIVDTNLHLFSMTREPQCLYRNGQLALLAGDDAKAAEYFRKAAELAPVGAYYRDSALKLAIKLGKK